MSAQAQASAPSPTFLLRAVVWWRKPSLDRALAAGTTDTAALRLRAEQLVALDSRTRIADGIELAMADEGARARRPHSSPVQRVSLALAHPELVWLVASLRTAGEPSAQAVAQALQLLTDDAGPLYTPKSVTELRDTAGRISTQLIARPRDAL
ncbi:hypothetical protein OM076_29580 [Solirubrobacter ginsenosidimutans]|uniref:Uncharacterized protein n=1 Tax=Solirubrobacter ginsenosidimutans TaxID=490573 RepID=A0A9X3S8R8_9ACTN|nr:hypothetical protein [Solirubrobacter ginsenosidimutans]MDA0164458.1 hypothetical protein [Solirubrobacter ginsenosidimutans]